MISINNFIKLLIENNIKITDYFNENYDNTKESIVKFRFGNFTNTFNKNKRFFEFFTETLNNVYTIPLGMTEESFNNIPLISATKKSIFCSCQIGNTGDRISLPNFNFVSYFEYSDNLTYLKNIAKSKYVLSPHGFYPDCYRHYESMYLSAIPITLKNPQLKHLEDMPALLLNDWSELSEDLLNSSYESILKKSREKLDINYWIDLIKDI